MFIENRTTNNWLWSSNWGSIKCDNSRSTRTIVTFGFSVHWRCSTIWSGTNTGTSCSCKRVSLIEKKSNLIHFLLFSGGAFGYFEATDDLSDICKAKVFKKGSKSRLVIRFSTVGTYRIYWIAHNTHILLAGESGSADTVRDPRGFAVKFYTDEGIWDLVGNNTPIFFLRDPFLVGHWLGFENEISFICLYSFKCLFIHKNEIHKRIYVMQIWSGISLQVIQWQRIKWDFIFEHLNIHIEFLLVFISLFRTWYSRWLSFYARLWFSYIQNG